MSNFLTSITAIWAGRGGGKSTLARKLIEEHNPPRTLIIDPVASTGFDGPREALQALDNGARRVVLRATKKDVILDAIAAVALYSHKVRPVYFVFDEAPAYLDKVTDDLNKLMYQGRHRAAGLMILSQRPTAVHAAFRTGAERTYWGRLVDPNDQDFAAKSLGTDRARILSTARPGQFIRHPEKD